MEWYLKVVRANYANFNGRASRQEYWMFFLFNIIFAFVAIFADTFLFLGLGFLHLLYLLAVFIPGLAVAVRRLHDVGKSGWWLLISLVPIIGAIWLLILLCTDSNQGENDYGPLPNAIANREEKRQKLIKEKKEVIAKHNVGPLRAYVTLNIGKTILIVSGILFIIILLVNVIIMKMVGL